MEDRQEVKMDIEIVTREKWTADDKVRWFDKHMKKYADMPEEAADELLKIDRERAEREVERRVRKEYVDAKHLPDEEADASQLANECINAIERMRPRKKITYKVILDMCERISDYMIDQLEYPFED